MKNPFLAAVVTLGVLGAAASSALAGPVAVGPQLAAAGQGAVVQAGGPDLRSAGAVLKTAVKVVEHVVNYVDEHAAGIAASSAATAVANEVAHNAANSYQLQLDPGMRHTLLPEAALDI